MSYLVFCTFDLKNADSTDYKNAYSDLSSIGLNRIQTASNSNKIVIPTTSVMGEFNGTSSASVTSDIQAKVQAIFKSRKLISEIFIVVGGDWSWSGSST